MEIQELKLTNFNNREFNVTYYQLQKNPTLVMKKRPLMLIFPGGYFTHLSLREGEPVAMAYASYGFDCAIVSYNLLTDPGKIYPDAALSGLTALKYFRDHSAELGINPDQIVTIGFSAGGSVVSSMNVMAENPKWGKKYGFTHDEVAPNATILGYPLINIKEVSVPITPEAETKLPTDPEILNTALGVTKQTPPTFIFQADNDPVVYINNSIEYITALRKHNVPFEAHLFDHGRHGFSLARPDLEAEGKSWQVNSHVAHWFKLSIEWLEDLKIK